MRDIHTQLTSVNGDVYLVHGINEYGGRGAPQGLVHMGNGFRVIAIDMPSFGRSSGLHAYLPSMRLNEGTLDAVMYHVHMFDKAQGLPNLDQRKRFAQGHSMGGFTVAYHAALHPPASAPHFLALDGIGMLAPMLQIAPESRPPMALDLIARVVSCFAGRLGVLRAIRGKLSDDPKYVGILTPESNTLLATTFKATTALSVWIQVWPSFGDWTTCNPWQRRSSALSRFTMARTIASQTRTVPRTFTSA